MASAAFFCVAPLNGKTARAALPVNQIRLCPGTHITTGELAALRLFFSHILCLSCNRDGQWRSRSGFIFTGAINRGYSPLFRSVFLWYDLCCRTLLSGFTFSFLFQQKMTIHTGRLEI